MAFGSGLNEPDEVLSEINMVPLIDVMLVMLIIFMLTVPVLTHTIALDLPQADSAPTVATPETVTLAVTPDGLFWDATAITTEELATRLEQAASADPPPDLLIRGDRQVPYEAVIQVMAAVQRAGITQVAFVTDPAPAASATR